MTTAPVIIEPEEMNICSFLSGGPGKAALVGGVVGGLAVIALVVVIVVVFLCKRQNDKNDDNRASKYSATPEVMNIDLVKEHKHRKKLTRKVLGN